MKLFFAFIAILISFNAFGQEIRYQKSYSEAIALADETHKPIFITLMPPVPNLPGMPQIKSTPTKEVANLYNKEFINYQGLINDPSTRAITAKTNPTTFPYYIFLDSKGNIVYTSNGILTPPFNFTGMAEKVLDLIKSGKTPNYYEQLDKANMLSKEQLKEYIILRQGLNIHDNAALIEKYIDLVSVKDLENYQEVLFILKAGPNATGKAYKLAYTNNKIIDSIFKTEPLSVREAVNNRMIVNTRNEAIKTKNISMAQGAAQVAARSWGSNYQEASKASAMQMLVYYKAINDTTRYYQQAGYFYDQYYLNITTDSARRLQAQQMEKLRATAQANMPSIAGSLQGEVQKIVTIQLSPEKGMEVANVLNNAAYEFYLMGTRNTANLIKALVWSRRSIELKPESGYYDTMAHIMYRLNFYDEAILNQNKAIEIASKQPNTSGRIESLKAELNKMKTREL
jgi:hypothetical protein